MKIAIATVQVPFTRGGAEILAEMLKSELKKRDYNAEIVSIPFKWYPYETLLKSIQMGRMIDLESATGEKIDKVITLKFPAYLLKHENKTLWLLHQHRTAYDLWGTEFGDIQHWPNGEEVRDFIYKIDKQYLTEYKNIFTIAQCVTDRLKHYCGFDSTVLYHPPLNYEKLHCEDYKDYIFYPSRINTIKRQRVLVEAMKYVKTDVKAYICCEVDISRVPTGTIKDMKLIIWAYCHKEGMKYSKKGYAGTKVDILADMIERQLRDSDEFGIGKLQLKSAPYFFPSSKHYGRQLIYTIPDFKIGR